MTKVKSKNKFLKTATSAALVATSVSSIAAPISAASFPDIEKSSHKDSIEQLVARGIVKGFEDGTFKPSKSITRGQAAKIIASVLNLDLVNVENPNFSDVKEGSQYYPYIAALSKANIISGYEDGTFKLNQTITRGQMAKMLAIGFGLQTDKGHPFTDVSAKSQYNSYIAALYAHEVTTGSTETTFSPTKHVTRGQLASFVIRAEKINSKPVTSEVSGVISAVTNNTITVDGKTYTASADIAKAFESNLQAFENAKVTLTVKENEILTIKELEIVKNVAAFDGKGLTVSTLSLPASIQTVANVSSETIYYEVAKEALTVNNVSAKDMYLNPEKFVVASIQNVNAPVKQADVTFNGSTVDTVHSNVQQTTISKTGSTIKNLNAKNSSKIVLNGDYSNVTISPSTVIEGNAKIKNLYFTEAPTNYKLVETISVEKVTINNSIYTWNDFLTKYSNDDSNTENGSNAGSSNTGGGGSSNDGESNSGGGSTPGDNSNTGGGSTSGDNSNNGDGSNTDDKNPPPSNTGTPPIIIDESNNSVIVDDVTYEISDEQKEALLAIKSDIEHIELVQNGQETIIQALTINTDTFSGSSLQNIEIANLTLTANTIRNVDNVQNLVVKDAQYVSSVNVDQLTVEGAIEQIVATSANELIVNSTANNLLINTTASSVDLQNTTSNTEIRGNVSSIKGGLSDTLTISSLASNVNVANVGANEVIVNRSTPIVLASLNFSRSLFAATTESNFTINFTGADYAGKVLTIKREDAIVDVQSATPFSKVNISGNDTVLNSNTRLAEVLVADGVTHLTLNANVDRLQLDLNSPIQLVSTTTTTIENLIIRTNTAASTRGWIGLLNVVINTITLNGNTINLDNDIFKKEEIVPNNPTLFNSSISEFDPDNYNSYGKYKLTLPDSTSSYYIVQVPRGVNADAYLSATNVSGAQQYIPSNGFKLDATTHAVIIYRTDGSTNVNGVSKIDTSQIAPYLLEIDEETGELIFITRYDDTKTVQEQMKYLYIFKDGNLVFEKTNFSDISFDKTFGTNDIYINTRLADTLDGGGEAYITDGYILYRDTIKDVEPNFSKVLTTLADKAHKANDPERIRILLTAIASSKNKTFDSLFLAEYAKAISDNKDKYMNDLGAILNLVDELTPEYQLDIQLNADDLYLQSAPLASTASYSVNNVVEVQEASSAGKIMFKPIAEGTTTVRIEDQNKLATLINVKVTEDNGKLVIADGDYEIVATEATQGALLDGANNFRFFTKGGETYLLPTNLAESFALVQLSTTANNPIGNKVEGYALSSTTTGFVLSAKREIEPVEIKLAELSLQSIQGLNVKNIGVLSSPNNDGIILFPRKVGKELAHFSDNKNVTGVNIDASETTVSFTIAKSDTALKINEDLRLDAVTNSTLHPQDSLDIHFKKDGNTVQFFANKAAKVAYVFADSGNRKTIVNVDSSLDANGNLTVTNGEIIKKDMTEFDNNTPDITSDDDNNAGATVTDISGNSVRAHNLEIFATQTGTSTVTLSNGNQYEFEVTQTNEQFKIKATKVKNIVIEASTLHMTNIKEATSSNASDRLQVVNGKLVVNLAANGTSKITVISNTVPVETTVLYVTKSDTGYTFTPGTDIVRAEIPATDLGLAANSIKNVFGETTPTARIKLSEDKNSVFIYGFAEGTRSFRVNDGTKNTAINVTVAKDSNDKLVATATPAFVENITANGEIASDAARMEGTTLYATGLGLSANGQATVEVPVAYTGTDTSVKAYKSIVVSQHPDTKLISFGAATDTFKKSINKSHFDFSTLYAPSVSTLSGSGISAAIDDNELTIAATADGEARVQVNESSASNKHAFVYVKRDGSNLIAEVEKSTATALKDYGYTTTPTALSQPFTVDGIVRAHIDTNFNLDFYALEVGKTAYKIESGDGKNLFVNVEVNNKENENATETAQRYVHTKVVESETLPVHDTDSTIKAEIIEGDAVRLSANKTKLYANKLGTKSIVKHANGEFYEYEVILDGGQYKLEKAEITKSATITKTTLGLDGTLQVSNLNSSIASYSVTNDGIIVYGQAEGTTSMTVSNGTKSVIVNVEVTDSGVNLTGPISTSITATEAPIFIDNNDTSIIRIENGIVYALTAGVAELLVDGKVIQVAVTKDAQNHYKISPPEKISEAVYSATDLGFTANAAMTIETGYNATDFSVTNVDGTIVAYSKLAANATGTTEFVVNASGERTLINLNDDGSALVTASVAKEETTKLEATTVIADTSIARHKNGHIFSLKEGSTYATKANGYIQAIDVTRIDGVLKASIEDVSLAGTFTALTETDTTLIGIDTNGIHAKKTSGKTVVQEGNEVFEIIISNTNNKVTIEKKLVSSKTLLANDAHLLNIDKAEVLYPSSSNAVTLSILDKNDTKNGLAIYSNTTTAQSLTILVTDTAGHKALIDVVIDETGKITKAAYVTKVIENLEIDSDETVQVDNARGVWKDKKLTIYATAEGKAALKFTKGLVNVTSTKSATNQMTTTASILEHIGFTNAHNISNGDLLLPTSKGFYPVDIGNALVHANGNVYVIDIELVNNQYNMVVSNGVPFTSLEIGEDDNYDILGSTLKGVTVAIDVDADDNPDTDDKALIIYKSGETTGTSDLLITSGAAMNSLKTIYHVKTTATTVEQPKVAKANTTEDDAWKNFEGATLEEGSSIRLDAANNIFYLEEKASTLRHNGRLVTVDVTRDTDGYFTATPEYVKGTVTVAPTSTLVNYEFDGTTVYATSTDTANAKEAVLMDDTSDTTGVKAYYTTFNTTRTGDKFAVEVDERKAYQYLPADFGLQASITTVENTNDSVATAKVVTDANNVSKLVIIAGTGSGSSTITLTDGIKEIVIKASRESNGNFVVTPQASFDSILFEDMNLVAEQNAPITADKYKEDVISVTETSRGLNINANKVGETSIQLMKNNAVVGLVNVIVEEVNDKLQVRATPVSFTSAFNELSLHTTTSIAARKDAVEVGTYYPTKAGEAFFGDGTNAQFVRVSQVSEKELYTISNTTHKMQAISKADLQLDDIDSVSPITQAVGALISSDQENVYVYGLNQGTTDITVSDGTDFATLVAINGASLSVTPAKVDLPDTSLTGTWESSASTIAKVRGGSIYTQETGTALLETTIGSVKVFMNVVVSRNDNRTFKITPELVMKSDASWSDVQVIDGDDVVAVHDNKLYAQQAGKAIVHLKEGTTYKLFEVTVTKNADGTLTMAIGQELTKVSLTQAQLGLADAIANPVITSINGNGVVDAYIVNDELVVLAKESGRATIQVNNGLTTIHFEVSKVSGQLNIQETIASYELANAQRISGDTDVIRTTTDAIFALKPGKAIVETTESGDTTGLYNVVVVNEDNKLLPKVNRIEYKFDGASSVLVPADSSVLKVVDGNTIVALDFNTEVVTVDDKTYKVTVNDDGTLDVVLYANGSFDFSASDLSSQFASNLTATSRKELTTVSTENSVVTIQPKTTVTAAGTDIVTVTNGTSTVQLKVTIEEVANAATPTFKVTDVELVSKTLNAGDLNGTYAHTVLNPDGTAASSQNAIINVSNGKLTIYPGEAGTSHFIVRDSEGKQIFLAVESTPATPEQSFKAQPLAQTIENNAFGYNPQILATHGKGAGTVDGEALNITFADTEETIFVTTSGNSLYHTVVTKATANGNLFTLATPIVKEAKVIDGAITDITDKLNAITHNGKTILYATAETPETAYFKDSDGIINIATISDEYDITTEILVDNDANAPAYTNVENMSGDDVVTLHAGKLAIKQVGTGIYKLNGSDYVSVKVSINNDNKYVVEKTTLAKHDISDIADSATVLAPTAGVYIDGQTIYGDTAEKVAISVTKDGKQAIYTAKEATVQETFDKLARLELNLLDTLGWTSFESHTLASTSQFGEIDMDNNLFIPKSLNRDGEVVVFTSASGISKEVTFKLDSDFVVKTEVKEDAYTYQVSQYQDTNGNTVLTLTFDLNLTGVTLPIIQTPSGGTPTRDNKLKITLGVNDSYQGTYVIKMPETAAPIWHTFTVDIEKIDDVWQIPVLKSGTAIFNYK